MGRFAVGGGGGREGRGRERKKSGREGGEEEGRTPQP